MKRDQKLQILLEMRPALDGYSGIPQETRLLFRGLCTLNSIEVEGLLQTSHSFLVHGIDSKQQSSSEPPHPSNLNHYSRVIVSFDAKPSTKPLVVIVRYFKKKLTAYALTFSALLFPGLAVKTSLFKSRYFEDFIWRTMFEKTLPATDFGLVTARNFRVCAVPWNIFQAAGLNSLKFVSDPVYPKLDASIADIFIAQTPYPATVNRNTTLVVRYHDAMPVFMPHTVANKSRHQKTHYYALMSNVRSGAYFACVSEASRQDLIRLFPESAARTVTIHNMVSHHFYEEDSSVSRVPEITRARLNLHAPEAYPELIGHREQDLFCKRHLDGSPFSYLLMVSTIEPRKNHIRLIAAWESIRTKDDSLLKLVIVGNLGWDVEPIVKEMRQWIDKGELFLLNNVPPDELRVLYRHAEAIICPSLGEGFDYSGVEAMRCGGTVIASDIPVHREVFDDGAEYFDPYSTESLVDVLNKVLFAPSTPHAREERRARGKQVSARYLPERVLPLWEKFLKRIAEENCQKRI